METKKFQKASKTYIQFISIFTMLLAGLFIYMLYVSGKEFIKNGFFWILVILILAAIWGFFAAIKITPSFGKLRELPSKKTRRSWYVAIAPGFVLTFIGVAMYALLSRADVSQIWMFISLLFICAGLVYLGITIIKTGLYYRHGLIKVSQNYAKVLGFLLLTIGIVLFFGYVILLLLL